MSSSSGGRGKRNDRVGERIREELMDLLLRGAVKDPVAAEAVIHGVDVTADLRHARVFVRLARPEPSASDQKKLIAGLERASGFLRREIGARLQIRHTPELKFVWDDTTDRAARLEQLLSEIRAPGEDPKR